ncbi:MULTISPECIES: hypothetical protein [Nocardia]|uniref:hypothetical protein n=1 Tax=Nocardia TaxID=1817 RepID=UPI0013590700|nr:MULTISPECIES: hypothetical protein [Nocardia]
MGVFIGLVLLEGAGRRDHRQTVIPERREQVVNRKPKGRAGGRTPSFDAEIYKRRNVIECAFDRAIVVIRSGRVDRPGSASPNHSRRSGSRNSYRQVARRTGSRDRRRAGCEPAALQHPLRDRSSWLWVRTLPHAVFDQADHDHQYMSIAFTERLAEAGVQPSVGAVGSAYDNVT